MLSAPPLPSRNRDGVDLHHLHVKQALHRVLNGRLVGSRGHFERLSAGLRAPHALLNQDRPADDSSRIGHGPNTSASTPTAGCVSTTQSAVRISWIRSDVAGRSVTCGRFEADRASFASGAGVTSTVLTPPG